MVRPLRFHFTPLALVFALLVVCALSWTAPLQAQTITSTLFGQSAAANGHYGQSVRDAGDLNHDGEPDLIIGAPLEMLSGLEEGRAFIFFGGSQERLQLQGTGTQEHFGWSVSGVGDVNGDGYDDVAVGAPLNNAVASEAGRVYVFFGGDPMDATPDLILSGEIAGDHFGWSVCRGGDLNDDGKPDFVVGAPLANAPGLDQGAVYLYLGASGAPANSYAKRFSGEVAGDQFGYSVADVPDFKGD
ncbi:MAG TPA: integrin alpha, partial [Candidatus Krumholzibacteria bacterium]|nr:integrin alpha [Candidatus Krumholzibacteria bacterium]